MITVDIKSLLTRMNAFCTNTLHAAAGLCVSRTHYEVSVEQVLVKLLEEPRSDCNLICQKFNLDVGRVIKALEESLEDFRTGNASKPAFSPLLLELIQDAWMVASIDLGERRIRSGALLMALLAKPSFFASGRYIDLLKTINRESLAKDFWAVTKGSVETEAAAREPGAAAGPSAGPGDGGFLKRFCSDFTQKARDGGIDPVFGRDLEIRQIVDILARRRKNNPICVGDPGVGKTAVVEGLALRIVQGDVPDILQNVSLLGLDMGLLEAGAGMKGEFENRLKGVISEIKGSEKPIILFIDEAHTLIGAGGSAGTSDAANLLKPALARGELRTVAATTWGEYKKYFEKDPALARRFQAVKLDEPSVETTVLILRGIRPNYEASHKVIIRDDAIRAAAELSDKYITGRFLPDKAIDLVDTACARIKINLSAKPGVLEDKERAVQALEREKGAVDRDRDNGVAVDEEAYQKVLDKITAFRTEAQALQSRWQGEKEAAHTVLEIRGRLAALGADQAAERDALKQELTAADAAFHTLQADGGLIQVEVNPDVVAQVVSDWTGIPLGKVLRDEAENILHLEERLAERIKGQDHALKIIVETIKSAKAGIKNPNQPLGVFLLAGPSGVGKTETGLALADLLFGSDRNVVTINMSEFQESHTVSRLIGSPPGYVGYGEGGMLTEAVRQKPYSVVLLDEVEKAHLDVLNLFYQVFDKGMLTDGEGKEINFRNTIIILTSNLASDIIQEMTAGDEPLPADAVVGAIRPVLSKHFKPALLARMAIVPYYGLRGEAMKRIVELKLRRIQRTLMENNKMALDYTPAVMEQIAARCTEVETGARNIEYILDGNILPQLSQQVLTQMSAGAMPAGVHLDVDDAGAFTFRFESPAS
jgi:type VI secretion system protein VasG